jgi:hypothetical protein
LGVYNNLLVEGLSRTWRGYKKSQIIIILSERYKVSEFGDVIFGSNKAKSAVIALAMTSIFNEIRDKKDKKRMILYLVIIPK